MAANEPTRTAAAAARAWATHQARGQARRGSGVARCRTKLRKTVPPGASPGLRLAIPPGPWPSPGRPHPMWCSGTNCAPPAARSSSAPHNQLYLPWPAPSSASPPGLARRLGAQHATAQRSRGSRSGRGERWACAVGTAQSCSPAAASGRATEQPKGTCCSLARLPLSPARRALTVLCCAHQQRRQHLGGRRRRHALGQKVCVLHQQQQRLPRRAGQQWPARRKAAGCAVRWRITTATSAP